MFALEESTAQSQNLCMECGIDMGECNPRQLCGKTRCEMKDNLDSKEIVLDAALQTASSILLFIQSL